MRTCSSYAVGNARTGSNPVSTVRPTPYGVVCSWYFDRVVKVLHLKTYFTVFKPIICIFFYMGMYRVKYGPRVTMEDAAAER